ncbi:MAG: 1,4-dihydroxy-2-naphthoate octaprenyltransferase [Putridiphycobacter sp.]
MIKFKAWIKAFRLRTLPLSFSTIITGASLANIYQKDINFNVLILIFVTTLLLQILSNLANDFGDAQKGTDNEHRVGPQRAVQSGIISLKEMKIGIIITAVLALTFGIWLLFEAFNGDLNYYVLLFLGLGIAAIAAAIKYTVGKKAYGYSGKGDLFVFIFFGLLGVLGSYFLLAQQLNWLAIFPAITIGGLSTAVLNLNNMRDIDNDANQGKNTLVVKMGAENAKKYHYGLFFWSYLAFAVFVYLNLNLVNGIFLIIPLISISVFHVVHLKKVQKTQNPKQFDPELKKIALSTFLFSLVLFFISFYIQ